MAINSYGYPNLISPGSTFARMSRGFGHRYSCAGFSDFRVTAASSGTRRVNIAAGWSMGQGIQVQNTATATFDFAAPSGTTQWFLLGLKRWANNPAYDPGAVAGTPESSPYISQLVSVAGTGTRAVPAVAQTPGTDDTQWLALCRVTSSSTLVQEVVDLRLVSGEGGANYQTFSDLAHGQLNDIVGARIYRSDTIGGHTPAFYERISSLGGSLSWKNMNQADVVLTGFAAVNAVDGSGWGREQDNRMVRVGNDRWLHVEVKRGVSPDGGSFTSNARGGVADQILVLVNSPDKPPVDVPLIGQLTIGENTTYGVFGRLTKFGNVMLNSMLPDVTVTPGDIIIMDGNYSVS